MNNKISRYVYLIFFFLFHIKYGYYKKNLEFSHAKKFGTILVQDKKGRIKPMNTVALELLRKISKKDSIKNLDANNWLISFYKDPNIWFIYPFIKISKKGGKKLFNITKADKYGNTSLINLYEKKKNKKYQLIFEKDFINAFSKNPFERNNYEKEIINLTEKVNLLFSILKGEYINILPIPNHINSPWTSWIKWIKNNNITSFKNYIQLLIDSKKNVNWDKPNKILDDIICFQQKYGKTIIPSYNKIKVELFYNKLNIFYFLMYIYFIIGFIIILFSFIRFFFLKQKIDFIINILYYIIYLFFIYHTFGLCLRWYVSFHAPWSNEYESIIFISWCTLFSGLILSKNKKIFIPGISCIISSILLSIAYINLINPEITNLVPVLKSYWLIIHVAIIISSYGFLSVSSFIGLLVLILFILKKFFFIKNIKLIINDLTSINELSMTIGLFLLTIGTSLGAIWANESWGSYWSWDPKETWALISIMVYVFILHMRLIPSLRGKYIFNVFSFLSILSILITYFGVNYYLSGLHSYAKGNDLFVSKIFIILLILIIIIIIFSSYTYKRRS
ncbi:ABC-type transport system involved in cytochrome c biogenesis, permease component [Candidatus Karelsulcia muelleri DMIN]|uniref:ABC-type transport system involved in cytochrome c biogenesis, permease component n=1 Tax=Karelsulcia muelleri (strain DMIN) TaxID=641892 RepID=D5D8S3_KARMD|nr:ABC-type transport system involved in cytochrome c biogenesis, permease component [Candidatus Karelsulcia muelleri DMIN]